MDTLTINTRPFGRTTVATGTKAADFAHRFSTKYLDEHGLYYYGRRSYSPELGRWVNRDPIGEKGGKHIYAITANDTVGNFDMLGLIRLWPKRKAKKCEIVIFYGEGTDIHDLLKAGKITAEPCSATTGVHCRTELTVVPGMHPAYSKFPNVMPGSYYTAREIKWNVTGGSLNLPAINNGADIVDIGGSPVPGPITGDPMKAAEFLMNKQIWAARSYAVHGLCKSCCCKKVKIIPVQVGYHPSRPTYSTETFECKPPNWSGQNDVPFLGWGVPAGFGRLPKTW